MNLIPQSCYYSTENNGTPSWGGKVLRPTVSLVHMEEIDYFMMCGKIKYLNHADKFLE